MSAINEDNEDDNYRAPSTSRIHWTFMVNEGSKVGKGAYAHGCTRGPTHW